MATVESPYSAIELVSKGSIAEGARFGVEEEESRIVWGDCGMHLTSEGELVYPSIRRSSLKVQGRTAVTIVSLRTAG